MIEFNPRNARVLSRLGSCGAFGLEAEALAEQYENIAVLTADLCFFSGLTRFREAHPDKFYNCGIAEENMLGMAAGLAKEGFLTLAATYGTFASMRCADQVRVNMGYMRLPIKLVGLTSGLSVGILGATHMSCEDIAVFRAISNIDILSPADCIETIKAIKAAAQTNKPTYIRLTGSVPNPIVYKSDYKFEIGKAISLREGKDVAFIAAGSMVYQALEAAKLLEKEGFSASVINMHTIKPLDTEAIDKANISHSLIVTLEEHNVIGGLGSAVAEHLTRPSSAYSLLSSNAKAGGEANLLKASLPSPSLLRIGIEDFFPKAGDYQYLLKQCGLTAEQIAEKVKATLNTITHGASTPAVDADKHVEGGAETLN